MRAGVLALYEATPPYVRIANLNLGSRGEVVVMDGLRLTERGRREVGQWPNENVAVALLALLDREIAAEPDYEKKSRLEKFRDAVGTVGMQVVAELIVAASRQAAGM